MEAKRPQSIKPPRSFDSAYGFSFSIALGLLLFIAGLVLTVFINDGNFGVGLVFGIPLLIVGLLVPLVMMRDVFSRHEVDGECPVCGTHLKTSDSTIRLECPGCHQQVLVREAQFHRTE
ncbi:MAG TPA: hypothetical protein VGB17_19445 [Pyrinomonadaceae bacterium]|jgi:predicted RNA-binding Zn-ribbon protein involved in translation (DUF1610 family)